MSKLPQPVLDALAFEKALRVKTSVAEEPGYQCPPDSMNATPGTLLSVEKDIDTSPYFIPPGTALSKFVYQSEKFNGSPVPVSGLILWPFSARRLLDGYSVIAWAHGTTGVGANHAPSNYKNMMQHFLGPYQLALQGYVVVATDYAGLGVTKDASGAPIMHEYLASPSQANDVVHSVGAARAAFPELSRNFVAVGHSQGGGAVWAVSQKAAVTPIPGYLGGVAISPYTNFLNEQSAYSPRIGAAICRVIAYTFPDFDPRDILTDTGEARVALMFQTDAGVAAAMALFHEGELVKPDWKQNEYIQKFGRLTANGGKPIHGPLLVIHGEADSINSSAAVKIAVEETAARYPSAQLECCWLPEVRHAPALGASQRLWMDWIADRFAGVEVPTGYRTSRLESARPSTAYHKDQNWYLEGATQYYQTV